MPVWTTPCKPFCFVWDDIIGFNYKELPVEYDGVCSIVHSMVTYDSLGHREERHTLCLAPCVVSWYCRPRFCKVWWGDREHTFCTVWCGVVWFEIVSTTYYLLSREGTYFLVWNGKERGDMPVVDFLCAHSACGGWGGGGKGDEEFHIKYKNVFGLEWYHQ